MIVVILAGQARPHIFHVVLADKEDTENTTCDVNTKLCVSIVLSMLTILY